MIGRFVGRAGPVWRPRHWYGHVSTVRPVRGASRSFAFHNSSQYGSPPCVAISSPHNPCSLKMREANVRSLVHCSRLGANVYEPIRPGRIQRRAVERLGGGIEKRHSSNRTGAIRAHATHDRRCVHAAGRGKENSRDFCLAQTVDWVLKLPSPINRGLAKLCSAVWSSGMIRSDAIDVVRLKLSRSLSQEIDMAVPYLVSQDQSPLPVAGSISPWSVWGPAATSRKSNFESV